MTKVTPPPVNDPIIDDDGEMSPSWRMFFNMLFVGDTGTAWTPVFTGMGSTGTPTYSGRYYKLSQKLVFFRIEVTPATDTTSTAGVTACTNFPLVFSQNGFCIAVSNNVGITPGAITKATNKIYPPSWTAATLPVTIFGFAEAQ
jgi:hypothetical protein